jgi:leader peptidase (prepilin peptidase) / N-methyltransferase
MPWFDVLQQNPPLLYGSALALGLILGSFLNVVILRLPRIMEAAWRRECAELSGTAAASSPPETDGGAEPTLSLARPPSQCPLCGHRIRPLENVPILSYLFLRGRCSACRTHISLRYPLVEGLTALLTLVVVLRFGLSTQTLAALPLTWGLIALAFIDYDTQLLPDGITIPLLWAGLLLSLFGLFTDSASAIIGAATGYLSLWALFHGFRLVTGKEGMGYGDFKLLGVFGAWFGWQFLPQIVLLSALSGALLGTLLIVTGRHRRDAPLPFGPFLAIAGWVSLIWGQQINDTYLRLSGLA